MSPSSYETIGSRVKVRLGQANWSHAIVVLDWRLQFHQCHVIIVVFVGVILWMFDDSLNGNILFISLQSVKVMFT